MDCSVIEWNTKHPRNCAWKHSKRKKNGLHRAHRRLTFLCLHLTLSKCLHFPCCFKPYPFYHLKSAVMTGRDAQWLWLYQYIKWCHDPRLNTGALLNCYDDLFLVLVNQILGVVLKSDWMRELCQQQPTCSHPLLEAKRP